MILYIQTKITQKKNFGIRMNISTDFATFFFVVNYSLPIIF